MLAALLLALLALPFVHRAGAQPVSPEISQFISMGGNLADICGEHGEHKVGGCESCNIIGAITLPPHGQVLHPVFVSASVPLDISGQTTAYLPAFHTTPPVRGPPRA